MTELTAEPPMLTLQPLAQLATGGAAKWVCAAAAAFVAYVFPTAAESSMAVGAMGLVGIDLLTALLAAYSTSTPIVSHKLRRSITKFGLYSSVVVAAAIAAKTLGQGGPWGQVTVSAVLALIIATELKSIAENCKKAGWTLPFVAGDKEKP